MKKFNLIVCVILSGITFCLKGQVSLRIKYKISINDSFVRYSEYTINKINDTIMLIKADTNKLFDTIQLHKFDTNKIYKLIVYKRYYPIGLILKDYYTTISGCKIAKKVNKRSFKYGRYMLSYHTCCNVFNIKYKCKTKFVNNIPIEFGIEDKNKQLLYSAFKVKVKYKYQL